MTAPLSADYYVADRPLLTLNQRLHHFAHARIVKKLRQIGYGRGLQFGKGHDHVTVGLVWCVYTKHRRDADNTVPTLKALCDGLVDAGVVPDDTPEYMTKTMPEIRHVTDKGDVGVWLTIRDGKNA